MATAFRAVIHLTTHLPEDVSAGDHVRSRQLMQAADDLARLRGDGHPIRSDPGQLLG
jgi:hypothetical protein